MSQYDKIGASYNIFKTLPVSDIEVESVKTTIAPYLAAARAAGRPARVLDLACGLGFYSHQLLEWGAGAVVGVDLSQAMVDHARTTVAPAQAAAGSLSFRAGDALSLGRLPDEEPFDVVIGVWLLNYSASQAEMAAMWRSIAANLRDGGVFIGIMPPPIAGGATLDARAADGNSRPNGFHGKYGLIVKFLERLESGEGYRSEVTGRSPEGKGEVTFRNYQLAREVYEQSAAEGGMKGKPEWRKVVVPQASVDKYGEEFWEEYKAGVPHMGLLVVEK